MGAVAKELKPQVALMAGEGQSSASKKCSINSIPSIVYDTKGNKSYITGKFLGRGGFAKCYEVFDSETKESFACKIVNKSLLLKEHHKEKMSQEIAIHRRLFYHHIVRFHTYFEDDSNVYIVLELCNRKTLMELHKRRRVLTEPEVRFFMIQMMGAVIYLHETQHVIHRDLKLGNIFINDHMHIKVGDFGLATTVDIIGERKMTLCGTPNYIAPEIVSKKGHSFEVDIWSIGCIMYTLLIGKPPFETTSLKDTYTKIKRGDYTMPTKRISAEAKELITNMLMVDPAKRPTARDVITSDFMTRGYVPSTLPTSCLTTAPSLEHAMFKNDEFAKPHSCFERKPLGQQNKQTISCELESKKNSYEITNRDIMDLMKTLKDGIAEIVSNAKVSHSLDDSEDPASSPMLWICKWVDYSDKYGFGYQLSDDSIGVIFNDETRLILLKDGCQLVYVKQCGKEEYYMLGSPPQFLEKKIKLLEYFRQYMQENLLRACGDKPTGSGMMIARLPYILTWFRTSRSVVMALSNGTIQVNNFRDHSKLIVCPLLGAISLVEPTQLMRTYKLSSLRTEGVTLSFRLHLKYVTEKIDGALQQLYAN